MRRSTKLTIGLLAVAALLLALFILVTLYLPKGVVGLLKKRGEQ